MTRKLELRYFFKFLLLGLLKVTIAQEPKLNLMPETIQKNLGEAVIVSCTADVPNTELVANQEWRGPNNLLIPTEDESITTLEGIGDAVQLDLFIRKLRAEDVGEYVCTATYAGNQKLEKAIQIDYYRKITFADTPTVQTPVLNSDAKIKCDVSSYPPPRVDWLKDGESLKTSDRVITQTDGILIKKITEEDEGVYRCRARLQQLGQIDYKDIQVEVHIAPEITGPPKDTSGVEKESVTFQCIAKGKPPPKYTWVNKDSELLNDKEGYYVDDLTGELRILDLRPDHAGNYRCTAQNPAGDDFAEARLRVLTKPKMEQFLNVTSDEGKETALRCVISGDPLPDAVFQKETVVQPYKNGANDNGRVFVKQETDVDGRRVGVLTINELSRHDDGLYTCSGISTGGETVAWGHITTQFTPTFEQQPIDEFWSWEQMAVNLTCLATSIPNATVQWYLREQPIREEDHNLKVLSRGPNGILQVHPLDGSYFDTYTCRATNSLGVASHDVVLKQVQKPGPVSSTQIDKTTATTVQWAIRDPLDDGGLPVMGFTVQYRLADTSWEEAEEQFWTKGSTYVVDHLTPLATYVFRFAARNEAGDGEWSGEKSVDMPKRSFPEEPLIYSVDPTKVNTIPYTDHYDLQWKVPLDNGEDITHFEIVYYRVQNTSDPDPTKWTVIGTKDKVDVKSPGDTSFRLEGLSSNSYYKLELRAKNKIGFSQPSEVVIKTAYDPQHTDNFHRTITHLTSEASSPINAPEQQPDVDHPQSNSGVLIGVIIIAVIVALLIIDIAFFFVKNVGVTAFIASKFAAKPTEKDKEAMLEEGAKQSDSDKQAIKNEENEMSKSQDKKEDKEEETKGNAAVNEALTKDSSV